MAIKIWNFLLPETGSHELKVERIGARGQQVYVDGALLEAPDGTTMFTGPSGSLLELRKKGSNWELHVNGLQVEEYTAGKRRSGDDTLRDLRSRPDGAYTIATAFHSDCLQLNKVRRFRFYAMGKLHEVEIGHQDWVWQIVHNGVLLDRRTHGVWENNCNCTFQVDVPDSPKLDVEVMMSWDVKKVLWYYTLLVNHINIPACWTKPRGEIGVPVPEVVGGVPVAALLDPDPASIELAREPLTLSTDQLPQGVSYDADSGAYQANIRVSGRYMFLGEFQTAAEAEARYLEEVEKIKQRSLG
jgi:hypothetical protein